MFTERLNTNEKHTKIRSSIFNINIPKSIKTINYK